jgi:imidazolonepropionase-like amidohydrolase
MRAFCCVIVLLVLTPLPTQAQTSDYLFHNGHLLTMTDQGRLQADLRVIDGRIHSIGTGLRPGDDTVVIDLAGGYLMPGLAEMHAHVPSPAQGRQYRDDVLFLWLAGGITTVRGMLGHPEHLPLRDALANHEVLGPRLVTSGPSFNGNSVTSPEQARQMVREQAAAGYDFLKIHPGVPLDAYRAMADEARAQGITFAGHVPEAVGLGEAVRQGQTTIDHLDGFMQALAPDAGPGAGGGLFAVGLAGEVDLARLPHWVDALRKAGTWVVPTETLIENVAAADRVETLLERPEVIYLPADLLERYLAALENAVAGAAAARRGLEVRRSILAALHQGGVGVLLGADSPQIFNVPGFAIHRELDLMVAAGLTPLEALEAGTTAPARFFGREDEFGRLAPGLAADLVWLAADPTADIANSRSIQGVMVRGRWLDRAALDAGLAEIAARYRGAEAE